ncbi:MAG: hypothetical protein AAB675_03140 [Patescibacteria group bacterium]
MAGEKLTGFEGRDPASLTPAEMLILGVASIQTSLDGDNSGIESSQIAILNSSGVDLTIQALRKIRTDPQYSEEEKLRMARISLGQIDWEKTEDTPEIARLRAESILTLTSGLKSRIGERMDELRQGIIDGYYLLSAQLILGKKKKKLPPVNQVRFIQNAIVLDDDGRRSVALAWASKMIPEIDDEQFSQIVEYFGKERKDPEAAIELGVSKLKWLNKTTP